MQREDPGAIDVERWNPTSQATDDDCMTVRQWDSEKFAALGRCVYARESEVHAGPFGDEHIIPFGLLPKGGDWTLPEASCLACAAITTKFEGMCLEHQYGALRAQTDLKTRRKKKRGTSRPVTFIQPDGVREMREISYTDLPQYCIGFKWPVAALLRGEGPDIFEFGGELTLRYPKGGLEQFIPDKHGIKLASIRELDFARMLAKIAHTYAVAKCGADSFEPMLLDLILGKQENAPYLVGGDPTPAPDEPTVLHDLCPVFCKPASGIVYLLVAIRLFAAFGMPRYHVVVGRAINPPPPPTASH